MLQDSSDTFYEFKNGNNCDAIYFTGSYSFMGRSYRRNRSSFLNSLVLMLTTVTAKLYLELDNVLMKCILTSAFMYSSSVTRAMVCLRVTQFSKKLLRL